MRREENVVESGIRIEERGEKTNPRYIETDRDHRRCTIKESTSDLINDLGLNTD